MGKFQISKKQLLIGLCIIAIDVFVFIFLGLLLMSYDDFYDNTKGEYWSLASMNTTEKIIYVAFNVWIAINLILIAFFIRKIYKQGTVRE
jgi:hypothetical protein